MARPRFEWAVDTHELAIHRMAPDTLRVSAGDGYYESDDAGATWHSARAGLDVEYLRSVVIDPAQPALVVMSASSGPHSAYVASRSDGRLYRRYAGERWERVRDGWLEPPSTVGPLLSAGTKAGELWGRRWPMDRDGVERALGQTAGWTDFVCCMKADLQHGIDLRLGRTKET